MRKVQCVDDTFLYGIMTSKKASGTLLITSPIALKMELSSTQQNSDSARQRSTLQASMSPKMALNLPKSSSKAMQPFRDLLKPGMWYWDEALDRAFEDSKAAILAMVRAGIHTYELNRPTCLCTDWSKEGLGFTLLRKHCRCSLLKAPYIVAMMDGA